MPSHPERPQDLSTQEAGEGWCAPHHFSITSAGLDVAIIKIGLLVLYSGADVPYRLLNLDYLFVAKLDASQGFAASITRLLLSKIVRTLLAGLIRQSLNSQDGGRCSEVEDMYHRSR